MCKNSANMGISSPFESKTALEALFSKQDTEIREIETMRRTIMSKIKCDKDYSIALSNVAAQGLKLERPHELSGSKITSAWKEMMEGMEAVAKLIRQNAEYLEKEILEKLTNLCQEKRKARKQYQDDYNRITQQLTWIREEVTKKKAEYQKHLDSYKTKNRGIEITYPKSGKKAQECLDRSLKCEFKIQSIHNDYVLLLSEADQYQIELRSSLLPTLLQQYQATLEAFVENWCTILKDVWSHWNHAEDPFKDAFTKPTPHVKDLSPNEEYKDFLLKLPPTTTDQIDFSFDFSAEVKGLGLPPDSLAINNFTVDSIKNKLSEIEPKYNDCKEKLNNKNSRLQEMSQVEMAELLCEQRKLERQIELIRVALKPPIPRITNVDNNISESKTIEQNLSTLQNLSNSLQSLPPSGKRPSLPSPQARMVDIIKKPFRRKSVPSSPNPPRHTLPPKPLCEEEWFHGVLPRDEAERLLTTEGDFIVRETTLKDEKQIAYVLSVCWSGYKHFIIQTTAEGLYRFEGPSFSTVRELITFQFKSGQPVTGKSGAILKHPVLRKGWELNNDDVILLDKIGHGNFGDVHKGRLKLNGQEVDVAVKLCRTTVDEEHKKKFLREGGILRQYDHPNIVKLIGICAQKQPIMIVMELVVGGALGTFLKKHGYSLNVRQLLRMCRDAAAGMCYLESRNCIHRDLAARNCLVGENNTVKISDFGMSREEEEYTVSEGMKQIPIKWTAPEALHFGKYTSLCDVWSYGILCWEIFSKGEVPYQGMSNPQAREKIDKGYRMPSPEGTPDEMYKLMLRCWEYSPEKRPHFDEIHRRLEALCAQY